jgi:signal transduction histidine kinase
MQKERVQTDQSLDTERTNADEAFEEKLEAEQVADRVVDVARRKADEVLDSARVKADRESMQVPAAEHAVVEAVREQADELLHDERARADARVLRDREDGAHALAALAQKLLLEREETDKDLRTERARSDEAVTNRDEFMAIVTHDLRDLLGGIVLDSESLLRRAPATEERTFIVEAALRIQRQAAHMNRIIGDLVDLAGIDAGKLACSPAPHDPRVLIEEAEAMFRGLAEKKGIRFGSEIAGPLPLGRFDYQRMIQVLANLISNAIRFTPRLGAVSIRGEHAGAEIRLSVHDTGIGIAGEFLESVFLRFWQARTTDRTGIGLGLYISRGLVEAQGGRIWVESRVGEGSVFHFTVPLATGDAPPHPTA